MFIKLTNDQPNQFPYSVEQLRRDNTYTSFPKDVPTDVLADYGVYPVVRAAVPQFDPLVQSLVVHSTPTEAAGQWVLGYYVVQKPEEMAGYNIRRERNRLLSETDWMALSDNTMTPEWATYRQALRDITSQEGFPYNVEWPTKPGE